MKRKFSLAILVIIMLVVCLSCATWKKDTVTGYEATGIALKAAYDVVKPSCDQGIFPADKCLELKSLYNKARLAYIAAGDTLILAINIEDAVKMKELQLKYNSLVAEAILLTQQFKNLVNELKAKGGTK